MTWAGTDEVANGYGGSETRNPSYLPSRNPECMYFGLGQVSNLNVHGLFDRKTDTAVNFSDETKLRRETKDPNLLDVEMPVPGNTMLRLFPDYFTKILGVPFYAPFDDSYFPTAPVSWGSWTSYYDQVKEDDIVRNTDWIASNLKAYGFDYVLLDEGYDGERNDITHPVGENHCWIGAWDPNKFPHGPQWLTSYIRSKGLHAGLWIVPNAYACAVKEHPDWYLRDKQGNIIRDYDTPALDSTNPQVLDFVKRLFNTLDRLGFEYYKLDGEHALPAYVPAVDRNRLYDKSSDPIASYRRRLQLIRDTIGPRIFLEGCPAGTPLNGIGYFNSYFTGQDVYNSWQGMYALFSSINANAFLNHLATYVMPGEGVEVGPTMTLAQAKLARYPSVIETFRTRENPIREFGTSLAEARTLVSFVSLTGVAYSVASVLPDLPQERVALLKKTLPTLPILPMDLFSRGTDAKYDTFKHTQPDYYIHNYPEIVDLKVNAKSGVYDVVSLTNWRSAPVTKEISFSGKLGLPANGSYVVFDFWDHKLVGVMNGQMTVHIDPHDTRVFLIHPLLSRPQLVGNSRHISGAYSILGVNWDNSKRRLSGASQAIPSQPYQLWFYIPDDFLVSRVSANVHHGGEVPVRQQRIGNSLAIDFKGEPEPIDWEVQFGESSSTKRPTPRQ